MVVGQENALRRLINPSRSGDIVVQTRVAREAKMDPLVSCFWANKSPTSTGWIFKPLAGMDLFGPIRVGKNWSGIFRAVEGNSKSKLLKKR